MSNNKQKVLISIDTEGPAGEDPVSSLIFGITRDGKAYGIEYLMKLFDQYGARGLFFVDFAEAWDYGENKIGSVVECVLSGGHDVGVHLHPDHMGDKERRYLWQYSFDEQQEMISKCTDLYIKMVGKKPLSFRGGRYGVNNDSIKILNQLDYRYDMSEFYGNRYCKLEPERCNNRVVKIDNTSIVEVPVTSYLSFKSPFYSRFDKVDCSIDIAEFGRVMDKICQMDCVDVVSFFVHSFSVLDWRKNPNEPQLSRKLNKRLIEQLKWVSESDKMVFIKEADLDEVSPGERADSVLDVSQGFLPYWFFAKRAFGVIRDRRVLNV